MRKGFASQRAWVTDQMSLSDCSLITLPLSRRWWMSPLSPYVCAQYRPCTTTNWKANRHSERHQPRVQDPRQSAKLHLTQFSDASRVNVVECLIEEDI